MSGEQQSNITSFVSCPNPNSPDADASMHQYSHGSDVLGSQPTLELNRADAPQSEITPQITDSTTYEQRVVNDAIVTTSQLESFQPMKCEVCNVTCDTKDVLEKHKQGKKHSKNTQKVAISSVIAPKMPIETSVGELENKKHKLVQNGASINSMICCETCNVICNDRDVFQKHLAGKKHSAKAIMQLASTNDVFTPAPDQGLGSQINSDSLKCEICKISCTRIEDLNIHVLGKKHLKTLKELGQIPDLPLTHVDKPESTEGKIVNSQEGNTVSCELCGICCNSYEVLKVHLLGKKHQKNLEKSEKSELGMLENEVKEEGKIVNLDGGNNRKNKRVGSDEDLEAKRRKIMESGAVFDALRTCMVCNVVCTSPTVYDSHIAGKKHAAMVVKQAETGLTSQQT